MKTHGAWAIAVAIAVATALLLSGCARESGAEASKAQASQVRVARQPPQPKDIIEALLRSSDVSLSVHPSCDGVGTEATDQTIGRYLSGFLAEQSKPQGQNWIETRIEAAKADAGEDVWRCHVVIRRVDGEDRWGWGVQFLVRQRDGAVVRESFRCTGAG